MLRQAGEEDVGSLTGPSFEDTDASVEESSWFEKVTRPWRPSREDTAWNPGASGDAEAQARATPGASGGSVGFERFW